MYATFINILDAIGAPSHYQIRSHPNLSLPTVHHNFGAPMNPGLGSTLEGHTSDLVEHLLTIISFLRSRQRFPPGGLHRRRRSAVGHHRPHRPADQRDPHCRGAAEGLRLLQLHRRRGQLPASGGSDRAAVRRQFRTR